MESQYDANYGTPLPLLIRPMLAADINRVHEIERNAYSHPWPIECFRGELMLNTDARYMVAETADGGIIAGYCGMWLMGGEAHITNVAVAQEYRRRHVADRLLINQMEFAINETNSHSIFLEVRRHNTAAQKMYTRYRFTVCRVRERYYNDNDEDAIELRVEDITDPQFRANLHRIKTTLAEKLNR